jgi:hypothetical protein
MLTLKKYLALSALSLTLVGQMNAMNQEPVPGETHPLSLATQVRPMKEEEQVKAHIQEAQRAYDTGLYLTKDFNNIVCDGDKALATQATYVKGYSAVRNMGITSKFEITSLWGPYGQESDNKITYELGPCAAYFKAMMSIRNNDSAKNALISMKDNLLKNDTKKLDPVATQRLQGSLIHMIINGNI